jgi:prepilin-type N-terminal cleavage/methylation domain-containing protein
MDMIKKRMAVRGQSGFTLVELLVAVAILAILAGVAVFAIGNLTSTADTNACKTEKDTFTTAAAAGQAANSKPYLNIQASTVTTVPRSPAVTGDPASFRGKYWSLNNEIPTAVAPQNPSYVGATPQVCT